MSADSDPDTSDIAPTVIDTDSDADTGICGTANVIIDIGSSSDADEAVAAAVDVQSGSDDGVVGDSLGTGSRSDCMLTFWVVPSDATNLIHYMHWKRMDDVVQNTKQDPRIIFRLLQPNFLENVPDNERRARVNSHINVILNENLSTSSNAVFKIGITYLPWKRIQYHDYVSMKRMVISLISEDSGRIAQAEIDAIALFRRVNRDNIIVNPQGDRRCLNRAPGGESAHHGISPFFLYVVVGFRNT